MNKIRHSRIRGIGLAACLLLTLFMQMLVMIACSSSRHPADSTTSVNQEAFPTSDESPTEAGTEDNTDVTEAIPPETRPAEITERDDPTETTEEDRTEAAEEDTQAEEITWLPMDGEAYIMGDPDSREIGEYHFALFMDHIRQYRDRSMVLYGTYLVVEDIPCVSFGENMHLPVSFNDGVQAPAEGSFVRITAIYTSPAPADDIPWTLLYMMVSEVKILQASVPEREIRYVIAEALKVRSTPDNGSEENVIGWIYRGDAVTVLKDGTDLSGEWCKIAVGGSDEYGYVKSMYLSEDPPI